MNKDSAIAQANLNRIDQYTPQGNITYQQLGTNADGTPRYKQTQTLSAAEQQKYDQNNQVALALNGLAVNNIGRVADTQSKDFNYDGMTPMQTSVGNGLPGVNYGAGKGYATQSSIGDPGQASTLPFGIGGDVRNMQDGASGQIQKGLDYSKLSSLPGVGDFSADAKRVADGVYDQATSRLDPRFQQQQSDMESKLAAQGISNNSDAYRREADNFGRTKNDAYDQAQYSAIKAGGDEQSRIFGLGLAARQQGQGEADAQGNYANSAQQQQYGQDAATIAQQNQAQQQRYTQGAGTTTLNNQAQDQNYQQKLGIADLFNQANGQAYTQDQSAAGFQNSAIGQAFNQQGANASLNNSSRQQQISEATYLRNLPLNEIASLLGTGAPVANPSFQPVSQVGVAAPDYQGLVSSNYAQAMQNYQSEKAAQSNMLGSVFGMLGTGAAMLSDRRFKENIRRIGTLANGLATYAYNYIGSKAQQFGVMAQEALHVVPEAVGKLSNGVLYVNYAKVY